MNKKDVVLICLAAWFFGSLVVISKRTADVGMLRKENDHLKQVMFGTNKWYYHKQTVVTFTFTNDVPTWVMEPNSP